MDLFTHLTILDGGMATELISAGLEFVGNPLWSSRLLIDNPDAVKEAHKRYLEAGARIIETNSYQASLSLLQKELNCSEFEARKVLQSSVSIAREAEREFLDTRVDTLSVTVAGSIGSYGCNFCDCSEYSGSYINDCNREDVVDYFGGQASALVEAGVDALAFDTVPSLLEAQCIVEALQDVHNIPTWISLSCKDGEFTCYGDRFSDAVRWLDGEPRLHAIGVNCTLPQHVTPLLSSARGLTHKPFIIYPNGGEPADDTKKGFHGKGQWDRGLLDSAVPEWIGLGARVIGGCCRMGPEDIARMDAILRHIRFSAK